MRASTAFSNSKERSNFETKPCAPTNFDSARVSLSRLVEIKSTGMLGNTLLISLVALKPSRSGITTSKMIKSGFSRSAFLIRSSPFEASPQTFKSGRDCSRERTAARIPGWSSAISIWQKCRNRLQLGLRTVKKRSACGEEVAKEPPISRESRTLLALISLQVLVNAVTGEAGTNLHLPGWPTYQELMRFVRLLSK